jgi:hypothetical protein
MIVDEHSQAFMIVTQQCVRTCFTPDSQRFARGCERQRQYRHCLKRSRVFRQSAVVRNQGDVEAQLERDWSRITKATASNERDVHALFTCGIDCEAIAFRDAPTGVE